MTTKMMNPTIPMVKVIKTIVRRKGRVKNLRYQRKTRRTKKVRGTVLRRRKRKHESEDEDEELNHDDDYDSDDDKKKKRDKKKRKEKGDEGSTKKKAMCNYSGCNFKFVQKGNSKSHLERKHKPGKLDWLSSVHGCTRSVICSIHRGLLQMYMDIYNGRNQRCAYCNYETVQSGNFLAYNRSWHLGNAGKVGSKRKTKRKYKVRIGVQVSSRKPTAPGSKVPKPSVVTTLAEDSNCSVQKVKEFNAKAAAKFFTTEEK